MISMIFEKGVSQRTLSISPVIGETQRGQKQWLNPIENV